MADTRLAHPAADPEGKPAHPLLGGKTPINDGQPFLIKYKSDISCRSIDNGSRLADNRQAATSLAVPVLEYAVQGEQCSNPP